MQISAYAIPGVKKYRPVATRRYTPEELILTIKNTVLNYYQLPEHQVFSKRRDRELVLARQVMHYLAKRLTKLSKKKIGEKYPAGRKLDHSTIIHSIRTIADLMDTDDIFKAQVLDLKREIEGSGIELVVPYEQECTGKKGRPKSIAPVKKRVGKAPEPKPAKVIIESKPPAPIIRMETLSEYEKTMAKYL